MNVFAPKILGTKKGAHTDLPKPESDGRLYPVCSVCRGRDAQWGRAYPLHKIPAPEIKAISVPTFSSPMNSREIADMALIPNLMAQEISCSARFCPFLVRDSHRRAQ
ncbi:hypothetical protein [Microbulbifer sp. MCCC 1A16149]|uniref:hypothetical protein n=1 Tax=Microbulbifer sp. MCCC 1A16149 TaxID=3411322 RepID=UPI003D145BB8